ncbi:GNAT family N-acetyltransferase [Streptomyces purpurogeneiscleroticus]|uniref:GNAT family N-acetyltransferase n=1 Tax=Streptomyces purpurogeneiscleroticus TaxID=68259 RepID=UPI001CBECC20|nr:GNAT family N-acetyltransferase [Streptomyces purpurogeneiscleroticus]MBZ4014390.1 GNAT family N-acetyltransferase [Streptomyces purpurogeneiscleroticus]
MPRQAPDQLVVTRATPEDWKLVSEWAAAEGWNPGLADAACFFTQDPDGFFLGRIDGEPVSAISVVNYSPDYAFLGFYLVRPDQRGRGHGLTTWKTALAHAGERTVGLDGVPAQQDNYRRSGFELAYRTSRYGGSGPTGRPAPTHVAPAEAAGLDAILAYDNARYPADRPHFLRNWLTADGHRALARVVDGRVTGYGVIRPGRDAHRVGPLFADTADDARALLDGLTADLDGAPFAVDVPESNPEATALATSLGLTPSFATARMYTGPVRPLATATIFGVTSLELG